MRLFSCIKRRLCVSLFKTFFTSLSISLNMKKNVLIGSRNHKTNIERNEIRHHLLHLMFNWDASIRTTSWTVWFWKWKLHQLIMYKKWKLIISLKIEIFLIVKTKKSRNRDWITITYRKLKTSQKLKRKQRIKKTLKNQEKISDSQKSRKKIKRKKNNQEKIT